MPRAMSGTEARVESFNKRLARSEPQSCRSWNWITRGLRRGENFPSLPFSLTLSLSLPHQWACQDQQSVQIVGAQSGAKCSKAHHTITAARGNNKRISPFAHPSGESFSLAREEEGREGRGRKMKTFNQHFRKTRARNSIKRERGSWRGKLSDAENNNKRY